MKNQKLTLREFENEALDAQQQQQVQGGRMNIRYSRTTIFGAIWDDVDFRRPTPKSGEITHIGQEEF